MKWVVIIDLDDDSAHILGTDNPIGQTLQRLFECVRNHPNYEQDKSWNEGHLQVDLLGRDI
jgi:hypothetical protein